MQILLLQTKEEAIYPRCLHMLARCANMCTKAFCKVSMCCDKESNGRVCLRNGAWVSLQQSFIFQAALSLKNVQQTPLTGLTVGMLGFCVYITLKTTNEKLRSLINVELEGSNTKHLTFEKYALRSCLQDMSLGQLLQTPIMYSSMCLPLQSVPFPVKFVLHVQKYRPSVLWQNASGEQPCDPWEHSLMSIKDCMSSFQPC